MPPVVQPPDHQAPSSAPSDPVCPVSPAGMGTAVWRDRLSQLLEFTGEGIFGIDLNGCCTFINRAGAEQLGWLAAELLGRNMHGAAHQTHADGAHYPEPLCPSSMLFARPCPTVWIPGFSGVRAAAPSRWNTRRTPSWKAAWCKGRWLPLSIYQRAGRPSTHCGKPTPYWSSASVSARMPCRKRWRNCANCQPCCAFGTSTEFIQKNPNTFAALYRSVLTAAAMARDPKNRELIAKMIAPAQYLNQPETVLNQVLTGKFADGLGNIKSVPDRADFDPMPWQSMAIRMLTQMKRWGYVKDDVNYKQIAEKVFLIHRKNHEP